MISFEISARLGPPSTIDSIPTPKRVATRNICSPLATFAERLAYFVSVILLIMPP